MVSNGEVGIFKMKFRSRKPILFAVLVLLLMTSGCGGVVPVQDVDTRQSESSQDPTATFTPEAKGESSDTSESSPTATPTEIPPQPTETPIKGAINPLTGEVVEQPGSLCVPPVLVSVSNFPPSARPQSGLAFASQVWETYIGEGMTRFLAIYYGSYVDEIQAALDNRLAEGSEGGFVIGPVRSGRVVFEDIKTLYPKGWLITAGASAEVKQQLTNRSSVYGSNPDDINSAGLNSQDLPGSQDCAVEPSMYGELVFDEAAPEGGEPADFFRIVYNLYNQIGWTWDEAQEAYLRSQDQADGTGDLDPATEAITGEQLAFENVLVLWAQHRYVTPTILEMELVYVRDRYGLLFRGGRVYEVNWSTPGGRLLVHDQAGDPIPLDPGRSFIEVVSYETTWDPQEMIVRYHNPPLAP